MTGQTPDIFLSYSRQDLSIAGKMAAALKAAGHDVWWDQALKSGEVYDQVTETALREARVVIVLWSKAAVASDWVRSEATVAMQRGALMPVMIEACQRPVMFELRQSADLSGWKGNAKDPRMAAFLTDLAQQLEKSATGSVALPPPAPRAMRQYAPWLVAALILITAIGAGWHFLAPKSAAAAKPIVAVLPFTDMSEAKGKAYFAEGLAEEILDTLAQDARLKVLGGNTSLAIRDNRADPDFARDKLGVTRLLEGSVRGGNGADNVKVSVRLIDTADGSEIWSKAFDRSGADVVAVQEEVAQAVAVQLAGPLGGNAQVAVASKAAVPPAAYEKVLVAGQLLRTRQGESILRARTLATEAITLAPNYAPAYAVRSRATSLATEYSGQPVSDLAVARRDAETAIKIDPNLADGFTALGGALGAVNGSQDAISAFKRALALKPDDVEARFLLGRQYNILRDIDRALPELEKAVAADPLWTNPIRSLLDSVGRGLKLDRVRAAAAQFRAISPDLAAADLIDSIAASYVGDYSRALAFANSALARNPKLTPARHANLNALASMFAFDRVSDAQWASRPAIMKTVYTENLSEAARMVQANGAAAWDSDQQIAILAYGLDPAVVVRAFDARFANVGVFLASPVATENATLYLAAAFDRVGRSADAKALRKSVRAKLTNTEANGLAPSYNAVSWAMLLVAEGDRAGALGKLEREVNAAWWPVCRYFPWIGDEKLLAALNGDPRFEAVKRRCRTEINKQRKLAGIAPAELK